VSDREGTQSPALVVFADDWGRHPSSCQHLVRRLREDLDVLWVNSIGTRRVRANRLTLRRGLEKFRNWRRGLERVSERMWVVDVPMVPGLGNKVAREINGRLVSSRLRRHLSAIGMSRPLVLTTLPYAGWLIRGLDPLALIYYCTDDYSHWPSADGETLRQAEHELSRSADLILAASRSLFERHGSAGRCRYFPHGVDHSHFASVQETPVIPEVLARLPAPRIGFFGLIYEKLDFDLLGAVARRFGGASLVLMGPVAYCPPEFAGLPNVHLLGPLPYDELPRYIAGLDVLLLPYVDDPMIRQSGPLKLRECLASGKPTVSVDVPEVRALQPHVRVAATREVFLTHVSEALLEPRGSASVVARQKSVEGDGWDRRVEVLYQYVDEILSRARTTGVR
jgi:glycosyltransferase involved in cell wall biosynthesis